jgi:mRNA interferase MazF
MLPKPRRGELYYVDLDPTTGKELGGGLHKPRPVVVLSINDINDKPLVVSVVPGTSAADKPRQYRNVAVIAPTTGNGLKRTTIFLGHQMRAIDHSRLKSGAIGKLSGEDLLEVEKAVRFSLGLDIAPARNPNS